MSSAKRASAKGKGKAAKSPKKGGKAAAKSPKKGGKAGKAKAPKHEKTTTDIELPNAADFLTVLPPMKVFPTMYETDVNDLKATFDELLALLEERKQAVLADAQKKVDKCKFDSVNSKPYLIDTATINGRINRCGTDLGPKWYEYENSKNAVSDCLLELVACEEKLQYVGGDFTKTKSVKGIKNAIGKVEAELKKTEPVLQAAKDAVKDISKSSLDEIRALPKPHKLLIKAVQACALLIGTPEKDVKDWSSIRKMLKTAFINSVCCCVLFLFDIYYDYLLLLLLSLIFVVLCSFKSGLAQILFANWHFVFIFYFLLLFVN